MIHGDIFLDRVREQVALLCEPTASERSRIAYEAFDRFVEEARRRTALDDLAPMPGLSHLCLLPCGAPGCIGWAHMSADLLALMEPAILATNDETPATP
jgi:hypothetical protein